MIEGQHILITGGLGFLGSHLVRRLAPGNTLTLLDDGRRDALRRDAALPPGVRLVEGDVRDRAAVADALADDPGVVIHLAAIAGVSSYGADPVATLTVAFEGTARLLERLVDRPLARVVNVSSSEVYGADALDPGEDDPTPVGPVSAGRWSYAAGKLAAEHLALAYHRQHGVPVVSLRPFNVYGPGQVGEGAVRNFVLAALRGQPLRIDGDGRQTRAWLYVDDFVDGLLAALVRPAAVGRTFNLGHPAAETGSAELAARIVRLTGSDAPLVRQPSSGATIERRRPSIEQARRLLDFAPRVGLDEGLRRTIEDYRAWLAAGRLGEETPDAPTLAPA